MEETAVLIERSQAGDKAAREVLIEENLGLVRHIVKRFIGRGYDAEDLFQIGCIGLIKAIDKFDLNFGVRFSTYAVPMIQGEIKRFLRDDGMVNHQRADNIHRTFDKFVPAIGKWYITDVDDRKPVQILRMRRGRDYVLIIRYKLSVYA